MSDMTDTLSIDRPEAGTDVTPESLKADADDHLRALLIDDRYIGGEQRALVILAMCSFACKIVTREMADLFNEPAEPQP